MPVIVSPEGIKLHDVLTGREAWYDASSLSAEDEFFEPEEADPICSVESLHEALKHLTTRQRFIVELRYGMRDGTPYTAREVSELSGLSVRMVMKHEQAAIKRLSKQVHKKGSL